MNVVVNGLAALKPKTGVGHHIVQVVNHLKAGFPGDHFELYPGAMLGRMIGNIVHKPIASNPSRDSHVRRPRFRESAKSVAKWASQAHFTGYTRMGRFDLYHEPNFIPYRSHLPTVVTVHDLSVLRHPEWHPADRVQLHDRYFLRGLEHAAHVIVVSNSVRNELIADTGLSPDKVSVVYNGVKPTLRSVSPSEILATRQRLGLPGHFFLCVGTIEPRKNIGTVLKAFADLPMSIREECPLLLAGPWGWKSDADRTFFEDVAKPLGVRHLGYVSDDDLPALYSAATALIYPSHYEGFGLPPLEMLACGGAVLASKASALREVIGPHGYFVDANDTTGWRDAMQKAATDRDFLASLKTGGISHAATFSWARAAGDTAAVYRQVLGQRLVMHPKSAA